VRAAAYEAGAWDFCTQPLDVETLLLKMGTFLRARRRLEDALATSLIDPLTGLYSERGLQHWAAQLGARAVRNHEPFACVVVMSNEATLSSAGKPVSAALSYLADVCRIQSRKSDIVGYVGESRFAILAPDTNGTGARQFIGRLQKALESASNSGIADPRVGLHAGYCAVSDFSSAGVDVAEVVRRAESALDYVHLQGLGGRPVSFDELPVS
jgi:GGDEF domain-containing protein